MRHCPRCGYPKEDHAPRSVTIDLLGTPSEIKLDGCLTFPVRNDQDEETGRVRAASAGYRKRAATRREKRSKALRQREANHESEVARLRKVTEGREPVKRGPIELVEEVDDLTGWGPQGKRQVWINFETGATGRTRKAVA